MKFLKFICLLLLFSCATLQAQNNDTRETAILKDSLLGSVFFDSDRHELRPDAQTQLKNLAQQIQKMPNASILLKGNTDADGSQAYNQRLSEKRVAAVQRFLEAEGVTTQNLKTDALGEVKPIADNETQTGKQRNRRVDVWIMRSQHPSVTALSTSTDKDAFGFEAKKSYPAAVFMKSLASPVQRFKINPNETSFLAGAKGTLLRFNPSTFNTTNSDSVEITLREVYSKEDIVMNNFNSASNGNILITGGMIEINAFQNGRELIAQKPYLMMMPSNETQQKGEPEQKRGNRMQLFVTDRQAPQTLRNGLAAPMNWTLPKTKNGALWSSFQLNTLPDVSVQGAIYTPFDAQIEVCKSDLKYLADTCDCHKLIIWQLDSLFIQKMKRDKKDISHIPSIVVSDQKPENYIYMATNRDNLRCRLTLDLAELVGKENHSYLRRIDWKMKHLYLMPAYYDKYEADHYDQLDSCINRKIRLLKLAKETFVENIKLEAVRQARLIEFLRIEAKKKGKEFYTNALANNNASMVGYHIFETTELNRINCDFFLRQKNIMPTWAVDLPCIPQIQYKLVFANQRVVLDANPAIGEKVTFNNVPPTELVTLVGIRVKEGKVEMAMQKMRIGKKLAGGFKYETYTDVEAVRKALNDVVNNNSEPRTE